MKNLTYHLMLSFLAITVILGATQPAFASLLSAPGSPHTGTVAVSSDGCGTNSPPCSISQDVIAGSTIIQAWLYASTISFTPPSFTIGLDGTNHVLLPLPHNQAPLNLGTYRADVTAQVTAALAGNSAHIFSADDTGGGAQGTGGVDGVGLVIVYSDASLPPSTVLIFDGGQQAAPTNQILFFGSPVDTSSIDFEAEMRLGIGFSAQDQLEVNGQTNCGGESQMDSQVDINGVRLTSCAGNNDDGVDAALANGNLFTLGGVGDDLLNPALPFQRSGLGAASEAIDDDERYDIEGFITNGDTQLSLDTENTSFDDNLFLSILYFKDATVDTTGPAVGGISIPVDTSALLLAGVQSISMWMIPVVIAGIGIGVFVIKRRK